MVAQGLSTSDRRCLRCGEAKPGSNFSNDSTRPDGKYPWCKACQIAYRSTQKYQRTDRPPNGRTCPLDDIPITGHANRRYCSMRCKDRAKSLRGDFGLTVEQYRRIQEATGDTCPICQRNTTSWNIDHDHGTGKVTGLVCTSCNIGALAGTGHDVALVRRLLAYLEHPPASALGIKAFAPGAPQPSKLHAIWRRASSQGSESIPAQGGA